MWDWDTEALTLLLVGGFVACFLFFAALMFAIGASSERRGMAIGACEARGGTWVDDGVVIGGERVRCLTVAPVNPEGR